MSQNIMILRLFPGMDFEFLAKLNHIEVVILEVYGTGTFPNSEKILQQLKSFTDRGGKLIITSQCLSGGIELGKYENSLLLGKLGAISAMDMTTECALIKAMHLYQNPRFKTQDFAELFQRNLSGEITCPIK